MKINVLILALFLFSFSLNSTSYSQDLIINQSSQSITVHHYVRTINGVPYFIELQISTQALQYHLNHGDHLEDPTGCEPPDC